MHNSPFETEEEELSELAERAYWEQNQGLDEEEEESYDEWLLGEISYWGYNKQ